MIAHRSNITRFRNTPESSRKVFAHALLQRPWVSEDASRLLNSFIVAQTLKTNTIGHPWACRHAPSALRKTTIAAEPAGLAARELPFVFRQRRDRSAGPDTQVDCPSTYIADRLSRQIRSTRGSDLIKMG